MLPELRKNSTPSPINQSMKKTFNCFFYFSILFVLIALYRADYLQAPKIESIGYFMFSLVLLLCGFLFISLAWRQVLLGNGYRISIRQSVMSLGLSIFGKYISGKIWVIVGRAAYIAETYDYSNGKLISLSFITQIISLWSGLIAGSIGLIVADDLSAWRGPILLMWVLLSLAIFTRYPSKGLELFTKMVFGKEIVVPFLPVGKLFPVLFWMFSYWFCWIIGFHLLGLALGYADLPLNIGFGFVLAVTVGIIAVIAPGGLGVREGFLTTYLFLSGLEIHTAATYSLTSRLWFFLGELLFFAFSVFLQKVNRPN